MDHFALSVNNFSAVFSRISGSLHELSVSSDDNPDHTDIELIQHIDMDITRLTKLLTEAISKFKSLKKAAYLALMNSLEKAIWNWMHNYRKSFPEKYIHIAILLNTHIVQTLAHRFFNTSINLTTAHEFTELQTKRNEELSRNCEVFFDTLDTLAETKTQHRSAIWPLQIMLLILTPKVLEEIHNADSGAPCSSRHMKKKQFIDTIKKGV